MGLPRNRMAEVAVIVAAVALYAPSLGYSLTFDDLGAAVEHPGVQSARLPLRDIFFRDFWGHAFGDPSGVPTYRPVATLSYWLDQRIGHGAPWVFHLTNLLLYALLLTVLLRVLRLWLGDQLGDRGRLFVVAAFASLAVHADVVPSVAGRTELLAMTLSLTAFGLALRPMAAGRAGLYGAAILGALLSKESALPFVLVIPLLAARAGQRWLPRAAISVACAALVLAFRSANGLSLRARHIAAEADNPLLIVGLKARLSGAMEVLTRYVEHTVTGIDLCPDYSYATVVPTAGARMWIGMVLAALATAIFVRAFRTRVADALFAFAATYVVASHILIPASAVIADRLFFFPSLFLIVAVALAMRRRPIFALAAAAFVVMQAILAASVARMWRDPRSLAQHTVDTCPLNGRGRAMRAHVAYLDGDAATTAWELVVESAIYNQFPRALPEDLIPAAWEALPVVERFVRLRAALADARYHDALARGMMRARTSGYADAEAWIRRTLTR